MNAAIIVFPGTNRERDMAIALQRATGRAPRMLFHRETSLPAGTDLVVLPGGFSYGDYLRCGAMAARSPIMDAVRDFAARGGHVLGAASPTRPMVAPCDHALRSRAFNTGASTRGLVPINWIMRAPSISSIRAVPT